MANVKKKCKVVMLPTEKASIGTIMKCTKEMPRDENTKLNSLTINKNWKVAESGGNQYWQPQHLYIISDEPIKNYDWFINELNQVWNHNGIVNPSNKSRKIIATTNSYVSFTTRNNDPNKFDNLPQPSPQFIEKYIEAYNAGNPIVDVMVEYEDAKNKNGLPICTCGWTKGSDGYLICKGNCKLLKVDKNNYITTTKCKESWSREEIKLQLWKFALSLGYNSNDLHNPFEKWIEDNL